MNIQRLVICSSLLLSLSSNVALASAHYVSIESTTLSSAYSAGFEVGPHLISGLFVETGHKASGYLAGFYTSETVNLNFQVNGNAYAYGLESSYFLKDLFAGPFVKMRLGVLRETTFSNNVVGMAGTVTADSALRPYGALSLGYSIALSSVLELSPEIKGELRIGSPDYLAMWGYGLSMTAHF